MFISSSPARRKHVKPSVVLSLLAAAVIGVPAASAGTFVANDLEAPAAIGDAVVSAYHTGATTVTSSVTHDGTIDSYMGKPGQCATLKATFAAPGRAATAGLSVSCVADENGTLDLRQLHMAADVWTDSVRPIGVKTTSVGSDEKPTGSLAGIVLPPVANAWYRHGLDLSSLKIDQGAFDPTAGRIDVAFELAPADGSAAVTLRVDNLSFAGPSFFVSETGSDNADGRGEKTAFATVQKAVDAAGPGDVVMVLDGTYKNASVAGIATIAKAGTPAKWITVRAAPGHSPKLINDGWEVFKLTHGAAYIELRGLDMGGNRANVKLDDAHADGVIKEKDGKKYAGDPRFNGNGISAEGRQSPDSQSRPHHLRFINNVVHDNSGAGISAIASDYVTIEGNVSENNCNFIRYGGSGISLLNQANFDDSRGHRTFVLGNVARTNQCYVPWAAVGHLSDGNSIIIDVNIHPKTLDGSYNGRTLVANNLCIGAGGGGITVTTSRHVDIVHNTLYHNVQSDYLANKKWGDLFISGPLPNCEDVRMYNNVVISAPGRTIVHAGRVNDYFLKNNVFFGDVAIKMPTADDGDADNLRIDPLLKNPSLKSSPADFRPLPTSPAVGHAKPTWVGVALADLNGKLRSSGAPTAGALLP